MGGEPNQRGGSPRWISGLLTAEDVKLSGDVLDRVDAIVPPGSEVDPADLYLDAVPPSPTSASAAADTIGARTCSSPTGRRVTRRSSAPTTAAGWPGAPGNGPR
jgi:hypothetical protein